MILKGLFVAGVAIFAFSACVKHEVVPAPEPKVDFDAHFFGTINGTDVEFTQNVLSYRGSSTKSKTIPPPPAMSKAVYYSTMSSTSGAYVQSISVGLGSVNWDASLTPDPTLALFNDFFKTNDAPDFSDLGADGFEILYMDQDGREWRSSESSTNLQDVEFTGIKQESDATGDYSKFICNFNGYVYSLHPDSLLLNPPVVQLDSLNIENAQFRCWFKR